jgi:predicted PurR-regulated permease PerM
MLAALVGAAAGGVPGALVATPLLGAAKAVYLDQQGKMPEPETEVVRRRLSGLVRRRSRRGDPPG